MLYGPAFGLSVGFGWYGSVGWYGAFGYGYPYYGYPYAYGYRHGCLSVSLSRLLLGLWRLGADQIQPRHAEVFIDGHFVGLVDDFDGWAQRLNVAPGEHELTVYLKGYQTYRENVLFRPGATLRLAHVLQPLAPGQPEDARPVPARTPSEHHATSIRPRMCSDVLAIRCLLRAGAPSPASMARSPCARAAARRGGDRRR